MARLASSTAVRISGGCCRFVAGRIFRVFDRCEPTRHTPATITRGVGGAACGLRYALCCVAGALVLCTSLAGLCVGSSHSTPGSQSAVVLGPRRVPSNLLQEWPSTERTSDHATPARLYIATYDDDDDDGCELNINPPAPCLGKRPQRPKPKGPGRPAVRLTSPAAEI